MTSSMVPADSPIAALFVLHVVIWNAVLFLFSLGVMLIYFRQNWTIGGQLIGVQIDGCAHGEILSILNHHNIMIHLMQ